MDQVVEPSTIHKFRTYGLKIFYIAYVISFWFFYKSFIITEDSGRDFTVFQTVWIWTFRMTNWLMLPGFVSAFLTILFFRPPPLFGKSTRKFDDQNNNASKIEVHSLIIRIVTMGKYKKMIEKSILYHTELVKKYLHCKNFSMHIVTEMALNLEDSYKDVKEILVPSAYKTKSGSMGKARNLAYWLETRQLGGWPESKTWIIDLDEDVILSESFMESFTSGFLKDQSQPKIGLPQAIIKLHENVGFVDKLVQIFRFTTDLVLHWPNMVMFKKPPAVAHGGCFVARADCSMDRNAECGPFCSISDDNAYILAMLSKGVKLEWIDGWFFEDAPTSLMASVLQRARWQRGHMYLLWHSPVPRSQKLGVLCWILGGSVIGPISALVRVIGFGLAALQYWLSFFPAGLERPYVGDELSALILATYVFTMAFGCWYMLPWKQALVCSLLCLTGGPTIIVHACDLAVIVVVVWTLVKEVGSGRTTWNVTEKVDG